MLIQELGGDSKGVDLTQMFPGRGVQLSHSLCSIIPETETVSEPSYLGYYTFTLIPEFGERVERHKLQLAQVLQRSFHCQ